MSIKRMSTVWEHSSHKGSNLLLMLAIADNANDTGHAWPGIETLAKKTRLSARTVMRNLETLETSGELYIHRREGRGNHYLVITGFNDEQISNAVKTLATFHNTTPDKMSPVTPMSPPPDTHVTPPLTPVSPDPSLTVIEPSISIAPSGATETEPKTPANGYPPEPDDYYAICGKPPYFTTVLEAEEWCKENVAGGTIDYTRMCPTCEAELTYHDGHYWCNECTPFTPPAEDDPAVTIVSQCKYCGDKGVAYEATVDAYVNCPDCSPPCTDQPPDPPADKADEPAPDWDECKAAFLDVAWIGARRVNYLLAMNFGTASTGKYANGNLKRPLTPEEIRNFPRWYRMAKKLGGAGFDHKTALPISPETFGDHCDAYQQHLAQKANEPVEVVPDPNPKPGGAVFDVFSNVFTEQEAGLSPGTTQ